MPTLKVERAEPDLFVTSEESTPTWTEFLEPGVEETLSNDLMVGSEKHVGKHVHSCQDIFVKQAKPQNLSQSPSPFLQYSSTSFEPAERSNRVFFVDQK